MSGKTKKSCKEVEISYDLSFKKNTNKGLIHINKRMKRIRITQIKSIIDRPLRQKRSIEALGIRKMHHTVEHNATPQILGIVDSVKHLIKVEEI